MTRLCFIGLGALLTLQPTSAAPPSVQEQLEGGVQQFRAGYRAWDIEKLSQAAETFEKACETKPDEYLAHYWLGVARFHVLVHRKGDAARPMDDGEFNRLVTEARKPLEKAGRLNESDSEAHALLATLAGMEISRDPVKALWLGRTVQRHRRHALRHGQDNPRTLYLVGAAYVQGPGFLGGSKKGLPYLERADTLFEEAVASDDDPSGAAPRWGHEHCVILIGQTYEQSGDVARAEKCFRKVLELNPENKLAQRCLDGLEQGTPGDE